MLPDAECVRIVHEILTTLDIGDFTIKLNHRQLLDGILQICGVPKDLTRAICSSIDKLDKAAWAEVRKEMVDEKGLGPDTADKIGEFVKLNGGPELVDRLLEKAEIKGNESAVAGLEAMRLLLKYCELLNVSDKVSTKLTGRCLKSSS